MKILFAGKFVADLETGELFRNGRLRRLQDKPFRLLELLLVRPRELASYDVIENRLWPDVTVDTRHSIKEAAQKLRQALGSDSRCLECLRGRGYRLMVDSAPAAPGNPAPTATAESSALYARNLSQAGPEPFLAP